MKYIALTLLFVSFILAFNSCKKDSEHNNPANGQWKWTLSIGGFSGNSISEPSSNSNVTLTLDNSLTYTTYLNNQTKTQGTYQITTLSGNTSIIHFDKPIITDNLYLHYEQTILLNRNDSLVLYDYNISEGFRHFFTKIK